MSLSDFLPSGSQVIVWLVGIVLTAGIIQLAANVLSGLLTPVPFIGPFLALVVQRLTGTYADWLADKLPTLADGAWQATEKKAADEAKQQAAAAAKSSKAAPVAPPAKLDKLAHATEIITAANPAARPEDVHAALDAAHLRNTAAGLELPRGDVFAAMLNDLRGKHEQARH